MADFSFSFDSDNPFAEPETAPKPAPKPAPNSTNKAEASGEEKVTVTPETDSATPASASAPDEFSLDALDFTFDEEASGNDSLPTQTSPDPQTAPRQPTPGEAAFAEFDFGTPEFSDPEEAAPEAMSEATVPENSAPEEATPPTPATEFDENKDNPFAETIARSDESATSELDDFDAFNFETAGSPDQTFAEPAHDAATSPAVDASETDFSDFTLDSDNGDFDNLADQTEPVNETPAPEEIFSTDLSPTENDSATDADADVAVAARPRRLKAALSVAILGASGIGKSHARWFHRNGCHVVGFLGTSDDSRAQTQADLNAEFGFDGNSYADLGELLSAEKPDIVCVATPPALHFGHVLQCLEAGANVLCEKPLVYAPTRKFRENRDGARELVKVAARKNLILGTQLQYGAATPILCKLAGLSPTDVGDFAMELETTNPNSPRDPRELWIDMGPHPISVAQMLAGPGAALAEETLSFEPYQDDDKTEVLARFGVNCNDGRLLMVRAAVRSLRTSQRQPRRRFSFNGHSVTYAPLKGAKGNFQAQFIAPDGYASVYADPVDYLIGDFVRACREDEYPFISGDFGRENLEWMLKIAGDK